MIENALKDILEKNFDGDVVEVTNESHLHAGHDGSPETGQSHFSVLIVSDKFENLSRVNRHRMVNGHVAPLFERGLHALNLRLFTDSEYKCRL